jgi:putative transposase
VDHSTVSLRYQLRPSAPQRRSMEELLEGERLLYNAALQEWTDSYRHACALASALGMERPMRWRLLELARQAGISVHEDSLPEKEIKARLKLLAGHRAAWLRKPEERAKAVIARDKVIAANAVLLAAVTEGGEQPHLRKVPALPSRQALVGEGLQGADLTPRQREALSRLLDWRAPCYESQEGSLTTKAQKAAHDADPALAGKPFEPLHPVAANQRRHTLKRLHGAIQKFYDRVDAGEAGGFPRFKPMSPRRWNSFGYHEMSGAGFQAPEPEAFAHPSGKPGRYRVRTGRLTLAGVEHRIDAHMHRPLPDGASVRGLTLQLADDAWHVTLRCRVPVLVGVETDEQLRDITDDQVHGLDWGVINTVASDDGRITVNPRLINQAQDEIERLSQAVARCKPGSGNRKKLVARLARAHRRLAQARDTLAHQVSAREVSVALERGCRAVAQEDGDLANLTRSARGTMEAPGRNVAQKAGYNRAQLDANPGRIRDYVTYKAVRAGLRPVRVRPHGTSRDCSHCHQPVPKELKDRIHDCPHCLTVLDRDVNGATNIGGRAGGMLRAGTAPPWRKLGRKDRREAERATAGTGAETAHGMELPLERKDVAHEPVLSD